MRIESPTEACAVGHCLTQADEGFSGGSTDRPQFLQLMNDIKAFDALVCYRLDRISRNVLDFSNILEKLNAAGTAFISITERFDTATPMGRAMVNIAAVFAQLERETTAERIRDNMRRLAITGRYIGSTPPLGFISERVEGEGRKKLHRLKPVEEDAAFVGLLFDKYLELGSLSKLEAWLMRTARTGTRGGFISLSGLRRLLSNPVYVRADCGVYEYYSTLGANVINPAEEFDGVRGMLLYGRHDRGGGAYTPEKWTVVLAEHEGIIPAERWLLVQRTLAANSARAPRAGTGNKALLAAKLRCGLCGSAMIVTYGGDKSRHYYKCRNKIRSRGSVCDMKNLIGLEADDTVLQYLIALPYDAARAASLLHTQSLPVGRRTAELVREKEQAIRSLTAHLRNNESSTAAKYIIADIEALDAELAALKQEESPQTPAALGELLGFAEKRAFVDLLIERIIWNAQELNIEFKTYGGLCYSKSETHEKH